MMDGRERASKENYQVRHKPGAKPMLVDWRRFKLGGLNSQGLDRPAGPGLLHLSVQDMV